MNVHETEFVLGDEAKALGDGRFEGRLVTFGDMTTPDRSPKRDWFDAKTDFGFEPGETITTPVFFHHGLDRKVGARRFGRGTLEHRQDGIYITGSINLKDDAGRSLYAEMEQGKQKLSSGVPSYLVDRKAVGDTHYVGRWVLGSDASITPTPADDRTFITNIKSLMEEQHPTEQATRQGISPQRALSIVQKSIEAASKGLTTDPPEPPESAGFVESLKRAESALEWASQQRELNGKKADAIKSLGESLQRFDDARPQPEPAAPPPDDARKDVAPEMVDATDLFLQYQVTLARFNGAEF